MALLEHMHVHTAINKEMLPVYSCHPYHFLWCATSDAQSLWSHLHGNESCGRLYGCRVVGRLHKMETALHCENLGCIG